MYSLRHRGRPHRGLAVLVVLSFVQMVFGGFAHLDTTQHDYCREHRQFEHVEESDEAHGAVDASTEEHRELASTTDSRLPEDGEHGDHEESRECRWLSWMQGPSVPLPEIHPSLLNLPPPGAGPVAELPTRRDIIPAPIDLLRLAPGRAPPSPLT